MPYLSERLFQSFETAVLCDFLSTFGNNPFMWHHAQSFEDHVLHNAYHREEAAFPDKAQQVSQLFLPEDFNVISSHVLYKVEVSDDWTLALKACVAPKWPWGLQQLKYAIWLLHFSSGWDLGQTLCCIATQKTFGQSLCQIWMCTISIFSTRSIRNTTLRVQPL